MNQSKSVPAAEAVRSNASGPTKNIVDSAIAAGDLNIFTAGITAAGLIDEFGAKGPFTVFAPTDEAFKKLPAGAYDALLKDSAKLKAILKYHVISGYFTARDVRPGEVMTLQGSTLTVAGTSFDVRINEARVTRADLATSNGIVHVIDAVILPRHWQLLAAVA
jgi:uncharacterized surface protein with fasciclin (FAS1) repeats